MKLVLSLIYIIVNSFLFSQKSDSFFWVKQMEYHVDDNTSWAVDILGNIYFNNGRVLQKFDSLGVQKFAQSIKSVGNIKEIMPVNTMKLVLFSEEQQVLCLMDNTLTMSENLIELSDFNIGMASLVAVSSQPDKVWVLDQLNSKLLLLDLSGKIQYQEVKNLKGILNLSDIKEMVEFDTHLFLLSDDGSFYELDMYGSLLYEYDFSPENTLSSIRSLNLSIGKVFCLNNDQLDVRELYGENTTLVNLPLDEIYEFKKSSDYYYFKTSDKILKYSLKIHQ